MAEGQLASTRHGGRGFRLRGVPLFLYHGVRHFPGEPVPPGEEKYWVTRRELREQLAFASRRRFRTPALERFWSSPREGNGRECLITFDDGRATDYEVAFPLLQEFGLSAEFFVNPANVRRSGYLNWEQIAEMQRAGMSFQSHAAEHLNLTALSEPRLRYQLRSSRQELEARLGRRVNFLAAPYGLLNRRVVEVAILEGYSAVCSSMSWPARPGRRVLGRVAIYRHTDLRQFAGLLERAPAAYCARMARHAVLYLPKQMLLRLRPQWLNVGAQEVSA